MAGSHQTRSTISVQCTTPSSLRHSLNHPSSMTTPSSGRASPRQCSYNTADPPIPAALTRVKGRTERNSASRLSPEMPFNDLSSFAASPNGTPRASRSRTPELSSTSLVYPSSSLLQDLLKEQRATRGSRGSTSEDHDDRTPRTPDRPYAHPQSQSQSQGDTSSEKQRRANPTMPASHKQPREMGFREMDQYVSKINKENFDLKLDIFHRAQQMAVLEKKLERMQEMEEALLRMRALKDELQELRDVEDDNQRLRESNEQLRYEIDKRDQAVTEAVELICKLEARVEELETGGYPSSPSTARPTSKDSPDATTPRNSVTPEIPERTSSNRGTMIGEHRRTSLEYRSLKRAPSFLLEENKSTAVLRSLYVPADAQSRSGLSATTKTESMHSMNETMEPESPRLSALSECSELIPYDSPRRGKAFDQIEIPVRTRESAINSPVDSPELRDSWMQPQVEIFTEHITRRKNQGFTDMLKEAQNVNFESGFPNGRGQRARLDAVFGGPRLPPTPDTMSTARATGTNRSNGSSSATDRGQLDQSFPIKRGLGRPRSAGELTVRRNSGNSGVSYTIDTDLSDATQSPPRIDKRDETPAIFSLNALSSDAGYLRGQPSFQPNPCYITDDMTFNVEGIEKLVSKMENNYYSPPQPIPKHQSVDKLSSPSSPPLTPQDWVEAANSEALPKNERPHGMKARTGPATEKSKPVGARAPSQSGLLVRRHSVDSCAALPVIHALDLHPSDPQVPQPSPEPEPRRRINLRPPFFGRLTNSRRLQPSPMSDAVDKDEVAPSPVIRKTRNLAPSTPTKISLNTEAPVPGHGELCTSTPTYADANCGNSPHKTLPHSFTESQLRPSGTAARPTTSTGKQHKRRSSLGIFGWMKGGGSGSQNKKADSDSPGLVKESASSPLIYESLSIKSITDAGTTVANRAGGDSVPRHVSRMEDEDQGGRRPRYTERRSRRA